MGGGATGRKGRIAASESKKKRGTLGSERPEAGENKHSSYPVVGVVKY